ncbi:hypothetical protein [Massiliimalia massiliensis]|uniref:hypothetical protein n=1 Tax=Massiliimalia massiliensis TaxID=1852384 RepID=UPI00117AAC46|nr:hypothetical protein [Massiliimalia massiliensis]
MKKQDEKELCIPEYTELFFKEERKYGWLAIIKSEIKAQAEPISGHFSGEFISFFRSHLLLYQIIPYII